MAKTRLLPLALAALWLSACAALFPKPEAPRLAVAEVRLLHVGLFEQRYRVTLRVQNPNRFDLPVEGLDYQLFVNDEPLGSGSRTRPVTIPGQGTELVEVEGVADLGGALLRLLDPRKGVPDGLRYRLTGHVRLARGPSPIPFDFRGELSLRGEGKPSTGI